MKKSYSKRSLKECKSYCSENDKDVIVSCFKEVSGYENKKIIFIRLTEANSGIPIEISPTTQEDVWETHIGGHVGTIAYRVYLSEKQNLFLFGEKKNPGQSRDIKCASANLQDWKRRKNSTKKRHNPLSDSLVAILRNDNNFAKCLLKHSSFEQYWNMKTEIDKVFFPENSEFQSNKCFSYYIPNELKESAIDLRCKKCKTSEPVNEELFVKALNYKCLDKTLVCILGLNERDWESKVAGFDFGTKVFFLYYHTKLTIDFCKAIFLGDEKMKKFLKDKKLATDLRKIIAKWFYEKKYKCSNPKCKANKNEYTGNNWECVSEEFE